ncbi:hypothetical protein [Nonomuraea sp. NPDC050643]|uniref:hypothetical protein n=1 Tax=Nonomuraea sp. NPDC050643 TaxID=3155660 RepID=UPI0033C1E354
MLAALAIPLLVLIGLMLMQQLEDVLLPSAPTSPQPSAPPQAEPATDRDGPAAVSARHPARTHPARTDHVRLRRSAGPACPNQRRHAVQRPVPPQRIPEAAPILSEPVLSEPVVSEPVLSEPVLSRPVPRQAQASAFTPIELRVEA